MILILAGCGNDAPDGPTLQALSDGDSSVSSEHPDTRIGTSVLLPMRPLCTSGAAVDVTGVSLRNATGGLSVASWGTRRVAPGDDVDNGVAGGPGRVDRLPGFGHHPVSVRCRAGDAEGAVMQFSVSLTATSARATATGVVLHYGEGRTAFVQYGVAVCAAGTCAPV